MDPIDRALQQDPDLQPSPELAARVMSAVRREAAMPPPLAFPWRRLVVGLGACVLWLVLGYRATRGGQAAEVLALARSVPLMLGLGLLVGLASLKVVRFCVRL